LISPPTEASTKLVEPQLRLLVAIEEVAGIELVIANIFEDCPVELVAAIFADRVDLPTRFPFPYSAG
jgi:hypothetical protein